MAKASRQAGTGGTDPVSRYGRVAIAREDIRGMACLSIDLRAETGGNQPDESGIVPQGTFVLSVIAAKGEVPIGEIRFMYKGQELSLVGHLTGREGVNEITPDLFEDPAYLEALKAWLG